VRKILGAYRSRDQYVCRDVRASSTQCTICEAPMMALKRREAMVTEVFPHEGFVESIVLDACLVI
jgi:hypothetical protein